MPCLFSWCEVTLDVFDHLWQGEHNGQVYQEAEKGIGAFMVVVGKHFTFLLIVV